MSKPSKETQDKKEVSNFYDMIIKIDSFRNLKKKEEIMHDKLQKTISF